MEEAKADYARCGKLNMLLFDPTHGTNRYGLKLCFFVTVGSSGQTIILAICLIKHEDLADIEWALRCFHEVFKVAPLVFKTDGASAIASAFEACSGSGDIWEHCLHQLCIWHLSKNFYEHVRPVLCTNQVHWRTAYTRFWQIAKLSDSQFAEADDEEPDDTVRTTFNLEWIRLSEFIKQHGTGSTLDQVGVWLDSLYKMRHKWAYCFCLSVINWGVNSTQRSEAANSAFKRGRQMGGYSLTRCITIAVDYNRDARYRKEEDAVRLRLKQVGTSAFQSDQIKALHGSVTPYGMDLILAQMAQIMRYAHEEITGCYDDHGNQEFWVYIESESELDVSGLQLDAETGRIDFGIGDDNDLGIGEGSMRMMTNWRHRTSVDTCSCQLKHTICRHILSLRHCCDSMKGCGQPLLQLVGVKWHAVDKVTEKAMVQKLNRTPRQPTLVRARAVILPRADRYSLLMQELRPLAELGSESMQHMDALLVEIQEVARSLSRVSVSGASASKAGPSTSAATRPSSDILPPTAGRAPPAPTAGRAPPEPWVSLCNDAKNLQSALGERYIIAPAPRELALQQLSAEGAKLVGSDVALKWSGKNRGGWLTGRIVRQYNPGHNNTDLGMLTADISDEAHEGGGEEEDEEVDVDEEDEEVDDEVDDEADDEDEKDEEDEEDGEDENEGNQFVCDWSDGSRHSVTLFMSLLVTTTVMVQNQAMGAWCCLKPRDLSDDVIGLARDGHLYNPEHASKAKGKKASVRLKKAHGPGSGTKKPAASRNKKK